MVFLVEDHVDTCELYEEFLRFAGYSVRAFHTASEALAALDDVVPDIIVTDLTMPGLDGWEFTRRVKASRRLGTVPVIAVSGRSFGAETQALAAGCDRFVLKPCLPERLEAVIAETLKRPDGPSSAPARGADSERAA